MFFIQGSSNLKVFIGPSKMFRLQDFISYLRIYDEVELKLSSSMNHTVWLSFPVNGCPVHMELLILLYYFIISCKTHIPCVLQLCQKAWSAVPGVLVPSPQLCCQNQDLKLVLAVDLETYSIMNSCPSTLTQKNSTLL